MSSSIVPPNSLADAYDTISGFETGVDRIDLSGLGATAVILQAADGYTLLSAATAAGTSTAVPWDRVIALSDLVTVPASQISGTSGSDLLQRRPPAALCSAEMATTCSSAAPATIASTAVPASIPSPAGQETTSMRSLEASIRSGR